MRALRTEILAAVLVAALAGCGGSGGHPEGSYERGLARFEEESWFEAVEDLRLFIRRAPTDARAPEAQYMIGMARYNDGDFPVAAVEFEILRNDYPTSERVDDAWYMQGMCYVEQVPRIELDQTETRQAVEHFNRYLREYPGARHRAEAEAELGRLNLHLDRKELESARLYRKLGHFDAAAVTIDALIELRPDSELRPQMLLFAGDVHRRRAAWPEAREAYRTFLREYPDHKDAGKARSGLARIDGEVVGEGN